MAREGRLRPKLNVGALGLTGGSEQSRAHPAEMRVGCSGWQYKHWRGEFYPVDLPLSQWLEYYAQRFDTVEINSSFYRLPEAATFADWHTRVGDDFVYAVKASRFLTHMKKLSDPEGPLDRFFARVAQLEGSLGPVLYQLPPGWHVNLDRLNTFVAALPLGNGMSWSFAIRRGTSMRSMTRWRDMVLLCACTIWPVMHPRIAVSSEPSSTCDSMVRRNMEGAIPTKPWPTGRRGVQRA